MLVEADDLEDRQVRVADRGNARAGAGTDGDALTPDLEVGVERTRAAVDEARGPRRGQRLTTVDRTRHDAGRVTVVEGVRQVRARDRARRTALGDGADRNQRVAPGEVTGGRVRVDVLVVADQHVVEQDQAEVARLVRQRGVADRGHVDGHVANRVPVRAANQR